jgi:hypothetical protein
MINLSPTSVRCICIICFGDCLNGGLTESGTGEQIGLGMKRFATTCSAERPHHEKYARSSARTWGMAGVSLFLGLTALIVCFAAASAFETPGTTSNRERIAPCIAAALYLAFCQFWVAPRGSIRFRARLPTLVASVAPLLLMINLTPRTWGIPWGLVCGGLGSVVGAVIAQRVTTKPAGRLLTADPNDRGRGFRNYLLAGFALLVAVAVLIPIGVIPSVLANTSPGFNARPVGAFFGITVVVDLWAIAILASALWRPRDRDPSSKGTLGTTAFVALSLGLAYGAFGMGILVGGLASGLRIASIVLVLCAVLGLITTALMVVSSVIVDRARLSNLETIN